MGKYTPTELGALFLSIASAIVLLVNLGEKIAQIIKALKAPNDRQDDRISKIEKRLEDVEDKLDDDHERFAMIAEDNRVTQHALIALLDHGLDGNNFDQMREAKADLHNHLINR